MQRKPFDQVDMRGPVPAGPAQEPASVPPWLFPLSRSVPISRPATAPVLSLRKGKQRVCKLTFTLIAASPQLSKINRELLESLNENCYIN